MTNYKVWILGLWYVIGFYSFIAATSHIYHFDREGLRTSIFLFIMAVLTIKALWQQNKNES